MRRGHHRLPSAAVAAYLCVAAALLAVHAVTGGTDVGGLTYLAVGVLTLAVLVYATRRRTNGAAVGWRWTTAGLALWVAGDAIWVALDLGGGASYPSVADALYLLGYPLLALGIGRFAFCGRPLRELGGEVVDVVIVALGAAALTWPFVFEPTVDLGLSAESVVSLAYAAGDLLLIALIAGMWLGRRRDSLAVSLLAAALVSVFVGDGLMYVATYVPSVSSSYVDLLWLGGYVLLGAAALAPASGEAASRVESLTRRTVVVGVALLGFPAGVFVDSLRDSGFEEGDLAFFLVGATAAVLLIAVRVGILLRQLALESERAEQARVRLATVFETAGAGMVFREGDLLTSTNPAFQKLVGYGGEELARMSYLDVVHPDEVDDAREHQFAPAGSRVTFDRRLIRRDGGVVDTRITLTRSDDGLSVAVIEDVTEQRRLERELIQAQKLEAVGRLAGGIAHDFNNLLTAVSGNAELLRLAPLSEDDAASVEAILQASDRAAGLTRQLLQFSRSTDFSPEVLDVPTLVRSTVDLLRRLIPHDVDVEARIAANAPPIYADPSQIDQVLLNLAVNASDAMPAGGTLRVAVERFEHDGGDAALATLAPGDYCRIVVEDTGTGMDEATRVRAFEPFFTTKEKGKGTGLGLATIYGIVTRADGHVLIESELGRGTTIQVLLPAFEQAATAAGAPHGRLRAVA